MAAGRFDRAAKAATLRSVGKMSAQYGYIIETSHGDFVFYTPVHHEAHNGGLQGWWNQFTHHAHAAVREGLQITQQLLDIGVKFIAIHEYVQGRRGKKVGNME